MGALNEKFENLLLINEEKSRYLGKSPYPTPLSQLSISSDSPVLVGDGGQFPPADDEQTVNTALILLIKSVCLTNPSLSPEWTLERKAFTFKARDNKRKLYEARTDGHLRFKHTSQEISLAILEVKANARLFSKLQYRECAQIVAWIRSEPDQQTQRGKYR